MKITLAVFCLVSAICCHATKPNTGGTIDAPYVSLDFTITADVNGCPNYNESVAIADEINQLMQNVDLDLYCGKQYDCSVGYPHVTCQTSVVGTDSTVRRKRSLKSTGKAILRFFGKAASKVKNAATSLRDAVSSGIVRLCPFRWGRCEAQISEPVASCLILQNIKGKKTRNFFRFVKKACYGPLGCYTKIGGIFTVPQGPRDFKPDLRIISRIRATPTCLIDNKNKLSTLFDKKKKTVFVVHGYRDRAFKKGDLIKWYSDMITELFLEEKDLNVVAVDWSEGADMRFGAMYSQAAANTAVVGTMLGYVTKRFLGINGQNLHCIGHSLGGHVCGFAGKRMAKDGLKLGRISGMDTAGPEKSNIGAPSFHTLGPRWRLDKTDAGFVDVIHTSSFKRSWSISFGFSKPIAHVDFYPNGGYDQPQCDDVINSICDHSASADFFTQSIRRCKYTEVSPCDLTDIEKKDCDQCKKPPEGMRMGYHANKPGAKDPATYYIETDAKTLCGVPPECDTTEGTTSETTQQITTEQITTQQFTTEQITTQQFTTASTTYAPHPGGNTGA